jgi:D-3-phosphoglycerate dehydrogenase
MNIVIPDDYQNMVPQLACYAMLAGHQITLYQQPAADENQLVERLKDADCVVAIRERVEFTRSLIARLPKLRQIALVGRHAASIDYAACTEHGVAVTSGISGSHYAPAEFAVALMMASRRNVVPEAVAMRAGGWPSTLSHRLRGSYLGILGLGKIGELVAQAGVGLGMNVLIWGREGSLAKAAKLGYEPAKSREDFFSRSDVLTLHLRLTPDTRHAVTPADLARMKPTSLLINTARAELIAPGALVAALNAGHPGYAAVDVYEQEPVVNGDHPLLKMPNVLCAPHLAWAEWETFELYFGEAFEQIVKFCNGGELRLANPEVKPRRP